jgi:hypothetical protein
MVYSITPETIFVHSELDEALRSLPTGVWDFYHDRGGRPQLKKSKGYGQQYFETELNQAKEIFAQAKEKVRTCPIDLNNNVHFVDNLFYKLNLALLEYKIAHLSEQHCAVLEEESHVSLADYFLHQQTKVCIND